MTRFRRLILAVVVGVLVTLPTAGSRSPVSPRPGSTDPPPRSARARVTGAGGSVLGRSTGRTSGANKAQAFLVPKEVRDMTRFRRLILSVVVGVLVTLPTAGSALAGLTATTID